jgi:hypothetical protein
MFYCDDVGQVANLQADCQSAFPSTFNFTASPFAACRYAGQVVNVVNLQADCQSAFPATFN